MGNEDGWLENALLGHKVASLRLVTAPSGAPGTAQGIPGLELELKHGRYFWAAVTGSGDDFVLQVEAGSFPARGQRHDATADAPGAFRGNPTIVAVAVDERCLRLCFSTGSVVEYQAATGTLVQTECTRA